MLRLLNVSLLVVLIIASAMLVPGRDSVTTAQSSDPPINAIAWSPDSARFATGDYSGYVKIWDAATEQVLQSFEAPDLNISRPPLITSISWNPDGTQLAVTGSATYRPGGFLWILDLTTGETTVFDAEYLTYTAAWSPDGTMLAAGVTNTFYGEHWIKVWDVSTQELVAELKGYADVILSVAWSPDGRRLASCSADASGAIWDTDNFERLLTFGEFPAQPVLWGAWSPNGGRIAATSVHGTALIWDATTGQLATTLYSDDDVSLYEVAWSPDGRYLAGVSEHAIKVWDVSTGLQVGRLESAKSLDTVAWSPDGERLLAAGIGFTRAWVIDPGSFITPWPDDPPINAIAWSPDSARYATADYDGYVKIWDAATEQVLQYFDAPDLDLFGSLLITSIHWGSDDNRLAVAGSATLQPGGFLWILDLATGETTVFDAEYLTYTAAWSPDGTMLAAGVTNTFHGEHWIKVWDVSTQELVAELKGYADVILSVAWSPDGRRLASCSADASGAIWDTDSFELLLTFGEFPTQPVLWGAWSPNGGRIAATSVHGTALIWDAASGQLAMTLYSDDDVSLYEVAWSPDGRYLAGVSEHAIKVWHVPTGLQVGRLESAKSLNTVAWSPDGERLLAAGIGFTRAWVIDPGSFITPWPDDPPSE